jgi:hypothetical protein
MLGPYLSPLPLLLCALCVLFVLCMNCMISVHLVEDVEVSGGVVGEGARQLRDHPQAQRTACCYIKFRRHKRHSALFG